MFALFMQSVADAALWLTGIAEAVMLLLYINSITAPDSAEIHSS